MKSTGLIRNCVGVLLAAGSIFFVHAAGAAGDQAPIDLGPRSVASMTVKQVTEHGKDEQVVRLRGRIEPHKGAENYLFRDDTGSLPVAITRAQLPGRQTLVSGQRVELLGQIDKRMRHKLGFVVKEVRLIK